MNNLRCVATEHIEALSRKLPIAFKEECRQLIHSFLDEKFWCFTEQNWNTLMKKYGKFSVSEADTFREGEIISGCCDRADQY